MAIGAGWPLGVKPISLEDLDNLGIDGDGTLYWAGRPMIMQQRLVLTLWQRLLAGTVVVFAVLAGLAACMQIWETSISDAKPISSNIDGWRAS